MALGFSPESSPSAFYPYTSPSSTCFPSLLEPDLQLFSNYHQPNYPRPSVPSFEQPGGACSPYRQISRNTPNHKAFAPANHCTTPRRLTWESLDPSAPAVDLTASSPIGQSRRHSLDRLFESLSPVSHFSEGDRESYPPPHTYDPHQRPSIMGKRRQSLTSQSQPSSSHSSRSHPAKRCKRNDDPPGRSDSTSASHPPLEIESIDLTEVEDKSILADALLKRREDAVRAQINRSGAGDDAGRSSLTSYKCPVCMDVLEDATTTICGHLFCHKCIIDTLRFGEERQRTEGFSKPKGKCPVCRKAIGRSEKGKTQALIPMELKFVTKSQLKGKEKAQDEEGSRFGWDDMLNWDQ